MLSFFSFLIFVLPQKLFKHAHIFFASILSIINRNMRCESDKMNQKSNIESLLAEYTALRTETTYLQQSEVTLSTVTFSFIVAVLGLNYFLSNSSGLDTAHSSRCILLALCPMLLMFFGCMWMNLLFRWARYGAYLYLLEADINRLVGCEEQKISFEHWIIAREYERNFFGKTSQLHGYVVFGTMIFVPALLYLFADLMFPSWGLLYPEWNICALAKEHMFWGIFLVTVYIIYFLIMRSYCIEIINLKKQEPPNKRVSQS